MHKLIVPALAALMLSLPASAAAPGTVTVPVPYGDLDLSSPLGMATLEGRIRTAIRQACGKADTRVLAYRRALRRCIRATQDSVDIDLARIKGQRPMLTLSEGRNSN